VSQGVNDEVGYEVSASELEDDTQCNEVKIFLPEVPTHAGYRKNCNRASCEKRSHRHTQAIICNSKYLHQRAARSPVPSLMFIASCTPFETSSINTCIDLPDQKPDNSQFGLYLPCVVFLKAGNLLYKTVGGENCMQCLHVHRICLILYLHTRDSTLEGLVPKQHQVPFNSGTPADSSTCAT